MYDCHLCCVGQIAKYSSLLTFPYITQFLVLHIVERKDCSVSALILLSSVIGTPQWNFTFTFEYFGSLLLFLISKFCSGRGLPLVTVHSVPSIY